MKSILITGSSGQIGTELAETLAQREDIKLVCSDLKEPRQELKDSITFEKMDVTSLDKIEALFRKFSFSRIYHLAAILSATGEHNPGLAWDVNMNGLYNMLEMARKYKSSIFVPSSIAAFGPDTPKVNTPQDTVQRPTSIYGITKVAGELLCDYYFSRFKVDTRGIRFPGLISYKTLPGGGTTDYAVDIFFAAVKHQSYTCFLKPDTRLDMMYMPDAIDSMISLMNTKAERLIHRNAFNVAAYSITPAELATEIQAHIPQFKIIYEVDPVRQAIADSWPDSINDTAAREEWDWKPKYSLSDMVTDMLKNIKKLLLNRVQ